MCKMAFFVQGITHLITRQKTAQTAYKWQKLVIMQMIRYINCINMRSKNMYLTK
jgi:hypothetical protein